MLNVFYSQLRTSRIIAIHCTRCVQVRSSYFHNLCIKHFNSRLKNVCCKSVETDKVKTAIFTVFKYRCHYDGGHLVCTRENR